MHDEEPAEHELDFSDDEEEAAYKSQQKRRYGSAPLYSIQFVYLTLSPDEQSREALWRARPDILLRYPHKCMIKI